MIETTTMSSIRVKPREQASRRVASLGVSLSGLGGRSDGPWDEATRRRMTVALRRDDDFVMLGRRKNRPSMCRHALGLGDDHRGGGLCGGQPAAELAQALQG